MKKVEGYKELPDDLHDYSRFAEEGHDKLRIFGEKKKPEDQGKSTQTDTEPIVEKKPEAEEKSKSEKKPEPEKKPEVVVESLEKPKVSGDTKKAPKDVSEEKEDNVRVEKRQETRRKLENPKISDLK